MACPLTRFAELGPCPVGSLSLTLAGGGADPDNVETKLCVMPVIPIVLLFVEPGSVFWVP